MFDTWTNEDLRQWWAQYGSPQQATFYPNLKRSRSKALRAMRQRGLPIQAPSHTPRPKGYGGKYLWQWGLGGRNVPAHATHLATS